jgi:surface carbohydrate biosynthesis protein (TIGR04326 family)
MTTVHIWDREGSPSQNKSIPKKFLLWNSYSFDSDHDSIPELVDQNEKLLRAKFLSWTYGLSQLTLDGKTLLETLVLKSSLSFWWLTNFSEKCNFSKSPEMDNIIKIFALELFCAKHTMDTLELTSSNNALCSALEIWCENQGVTFINIKMNSARSTHRLRSFLPEKLKALLWLIIYLFQRRALFGLNLNEWRATSKKITFFSYFCNLDSSKLQVSKYGSSFWGDLPNMLSSEAIQSNWLHIYVESELLPNAAIAAQAITRISILNKDELHITLDTFMSFRLIFQVLKDWIFIQRIGLKFYSIFSSHSPYSKLLILDWKKTFYGIDGLKNLLMHHQLLESQKNLPKQEVGFYLQEFQPWESSLINAWNRYSNGKIIATPHSTIRFWDLRYFNDPRCFEGPINTRMPLPGEIALNGALQKQNYDVASLSGVQTTDVEALRYMHLNESCDEGVRRKSARDSDFVILVMGDYKLENTITQLRMLKECLEELPSAPKILFKPHPVSSQPQSLFDNMEVTVIQDPIEEILPLCDLAIASNVTTAALDAFLKKIPVICIFNPSKMNLSPLKELNSNLFASSPAELLDKIVLVKENTPISFCDPKEAFNLDSDLCLWLNLINNRINDNFEELH